MAKAPKTPCIGICSTGIGDDVCRGCKRFAEEVVSWNTYSNAEKQAVLNRLEALLVQTVESKFLIADQARLEHQMRFQQIDCDFSKNPYHWVFQLLRVGAGQIQQLGDYGLVLRQDQQDFELSAIKLQIDQEFYTLSCAYYERYILPGQLATPV